MSQSLFAGCGLDSHNGAASTAKLKTCRNPYSLDVGWIVRKARFTRASNSSRNPYSLDVGWIEVCYSDKLTLTNKSQSLFAGCGLDRNRLW